MESAQPKFLAKGTTLQNGKYTIIDVLGHGGFGITYLANDKAFGKVAIKELFLSSSDIHCSRENVTQRNVVPHFDATQFEQFKERFESEARTLFDLTDINGVVRVLNIFEENSTVYFSMEYLDGEKLEDYVKTRGKLSDTEGVALVNAIGKTVSEIHQRNILHRDIKPANIIITKTGRVVLIDFGIARSNFDDLNDHTTYHTRIYSPPEQRISKSPMGKYSDVYALGATAYFILSGVPPQAIEERITGEYEDAKHVNPTLPDHINEAITKSLAIKKEERFQTVEAFLAALNGSAQPQTSPLFTPQTADDLRKNEATSPKNDEATRIEIPISPKTNDQATLIEQSPKTTPPPPVVAADMTHIEATPKRADDNQTLIEPMQKPVKKPTISKNKIWIGSGIAVAIAAITYIAIPSTPTPPVPVAPPPVTDTAKVKVEDTKKNSMAFALDNLTGQWFYNTTPLTLNSTPDLTFTYGKKAGEWLIDSAKNDVVFFKLLLGSDRYEFKGFPFSAGKKMILQGISGNFKKLGLIDAPVFKGSPMDSLTKVPPPPIKTGTQKIETSQNGQIYSSPYTSAPAASPAPKPNPPTEKKPTPSVSADVWTEQRLMTELVGHNWECKNEKLVLSSDKTFIFDKNKGTWDMSNFTPKLDGMSLVLKGNRSTAVFVIRKSSNSIILQMLSDNTEKFKDKFFFK